MNKVVEKWDEILQIVKTEHDLSDVSFNTWLKPLTVYEVVDNVVTIIVPSEQVGLNYISKKYKLPLQVTISEVTGMENCDINFILPEDVPKKEEVSPKAQSQDARCEEAHLNPKYTFDTFVVGKTKNLQGVYNINKGYAVFRKVSVLCENAEYYIVQENEPYGLSNYDHIVQEGSSVNSNDVVFQ